MSNNADFDALANELRALRLADGAASRSGTESVLVARLLPGFSVNRWREFLRRYPTGRWCAPPAGPGLPPDMSGGCGNAPDHLAHLLMAEMFTVQIQRELLRLSRTGGDLALVETRPVRPRNLGGSSLGQPTVQALEVCLVDCSRQCREECDTLGLHRARPLCPAAAGCGRAARPFDGRTDTKNICGPSCGNNRCLWQGQTHRQGPVCHWHSLCRSGADRPPEALLGKATQAMSDALAQKHGHICIAGGTALETRNTLVQSSEKRFLFLWGKLMANTTLSIALLSGKGGVGKTNMSLNLACVLHQMGFKTLLMDCDLGLANLDVLLGITPEGNLQTALLGEAGRF